MTAVLLQRDGLQEKIQHLQKQLTLCGILEEELYECTERFLIQEEIYDVTFIEESHVSRYKQWLESSGKYIRKQVIQRTVSLRKVRDYWVQHEYHELITEIEQCDEVCRDMVTHVKRFLIRQRIHHLREIDYTVRECYEKELLEKKSYQKTLEYLKALDRLKQSSICSESKHFTADGIKWNQYKEQILFLPYHPDQKLAMDFDQVRDKQELVWNFSINTSDTLRRQVFWLLNYILENVEKTDQKERRVRFLLPLKWLYEFCVAQNIQDIEKIELEHIRMLHEVIEDKIVNVNNAMQIVDNCRMFLFMNSKEIHWHANVWYIERFKLSQHRINPSNPVKRLSFLEVTNQKNRELLQEYARYLVGITDLSIGVIRTQLYNVRQFMEDFQKEESVCDIGKEQMDNYFKVLQCRDIKDETYNIKLADITKFYRYLRVKGYIRKIPFELEFYLKKSYPQHLDRSVEKEVYQEILKKLYLFPEVPRLIFLNLWSAGLRLSEVCTLKGDAYYWDGEDAWLKVYQIKMKADKMIPIPMVLYWIMQRYMEKNRIHAKDYIFQAKQGGAYRTGTFMKAFKYHCKKNEIGDCSYLFKSHDYRHTLATGFYDAGVSIQTIRDYLGHVTEDMTKQYIDYMPRKIAEASEEYFSKPGKNLATTITIKKRRDKHEG